MVTIRDGQVVEVPDQFTPSDNPDTFYDRLELVLERLETHKARKAQPS